MIHKIYLDKGLKKKTTTWLFCYRLENRFHLSSYVATQNTDKSQRCYILFTKHTFILGLMNMLDTHRIREESLVMWPTLYNGN